MKLASTGEGFQIFSDHDLELKVTNPWRLIAALQIWRRRGMWSSQSNGLELLFIVVYVVIVIVIVIIDASDNNSYFQHC